MKTIKYFLLSLFIIACSNNQTNIRHSLLLNDSALKVLQNSKLDILEKNQNALKLLNEALQYDSTNQAINMNITSCFISLKDYDSAIYQIEKYQRITKRTNPIQTTLLGMIFEKLGCTEKANQYYDSALVNYGQIELIKKINDINYYLLLLLKGTEKNILIKDITNNPQINKKQYYLDFIVKFNKERYINELLS